MHTTYMRYTVYINNDNDENFKQEENKSGLLNDLLDFHYRILDGVEDKTRRGEPLTYEELEDTFEKAKMPGMNKLVKTLKEKAPDADKAAIERFNRLQKGKKDTK